MSVSQILDEIRENHLCTFPGHDRPLFKISAQYNGYWLEHTFDALVWSYYVGDGGALIRSQIDLYLERQKEDGQLPYCLFIHPEWGLTVGYGQLQECVSMGSLCLDTYRLNPDACDLKRYYTAVSDWVNWQKKYRMTTKRGLVETFCGYDTGHDNSPRWADCKYKNGLPEKDAEIAPTDCPKAPLLSPDVNAVYFGNLSALSEMAKILGKASEAESWRAEAQQVRDLIFTHLYDETDGFFYDVDKNGAKIPVKSISVTALFYEKVLTQEEADALYTRYFKNEKEFLSPMPFPGISQSDPHFIDPKSINIWGYYSQALVALRTLRWMPHYGYDADWKDLLLKWREAFKKSEFPYGQELHPMTGITTGHSPNYSSCLLTCLIAEKVL